MVVLVQGREGEGRGKGDSRATEKGDKCMKARGEGGAGGQGPPCRPGQQGPPKTSFHHLSTHVHIQNCTINTTLPPPHHHHLSTGVGGTGARPRRRCFLRRVTTRLCLSTPPTTPPPHVNRLIIMMFANS